MIVYVITEDCIDPYFGDEFSGVVFSNLADAEKFIAEDKNKNIVEIELDKIS